MYNHAIATLALAEAYALSIPTPSLQASVQRAVNLLVQAQRAAGGWRYEIHGDDMDTSVTAWCVQALVAAQQCGLEVPERCLTTADAWIRSLTRPETGVTGYLKPGDPGVRLKAVCEEYTPQGALIGAGILCRVLLGTSPKDRLIKLGCSRLQDYLPAWRAPVLDLYGWYYNSHALAQIRGRTWKQYCKALQQALLPHQETEGGRAGSWAPVGPWGGAGGRIYSTAMAVLCLESCYRYGRP
jgi:hypothetical protein